MRSRTAFTILETLITMSVLLVSLLLMMGLMIRFMIISEVSLVTVNLSDDLLKASMKIREELLKIGPEAYRVQLYKDGKSYPGIAEGDEVRFTLSVPFGDERGFYYKDLEYAVKFDRAGKRVVVAEVQENGLRVLRVLAEKIEDCQFRIPESGIVSFSVLKREGRVSRSMKTTISLLNTK